MSSWFQTTNIASLAKNALKEAQKTIDKALDINQEHSGEPGSDGDGTTSSQNQINHLSDLTNTVTGAASEFFNTWAVPGIRKESEPLQSPPEDNTKPNAVVTSPPNSTTTTTTSKSVNTRKPKSRTRRKSSKSSRASTAPTSTPAEGDIGTFTELSLSDGEHTIANEPNLVDLGDDKPEEDTIHNESKEVFSFQPLWLETAEHDNGTEDTEKNTLSTLLQPSDPGENILAQTGNDIIQESSHQEKQNETANANERPKESPIDRENQELIPEPPKVPKSVLSESIPSDVNATTSEDDDLNRKRMNSESDTNTVTITDLESSSGTIMQDSRDNSDENEVVVERPDQLMLLGDSGETEKYRETNEGPDHNSSPTILSPSSRATSSVSVISEEKAEYDSRSPTNSNNSGPSSPNSPSADSQMLIEIKQSGLAHSATPDCGHSRSNSNSTSSSIDQQHQTHAQSQHQHHSSRPHIPFPNHVYSQGGRIIANFPLSSASSSDIEVIPLDSLESSMLYHAQTRRASLVEVETQTDETPSPVPTKLSNILAEKESEITQLREEGEKLSKKQFDLSTIIKKLRAKEKETEGIIKGLKNEIDSKSIEIERVTKTFLQKESIEQKQVQTITKLNSEKTKLEDMISELRSELEDSTENCASMKASLEDASIEILELQNTIASAQHDTTQIDTLTREKSHLSQQNQSYKNEIEQLRSSLSSIQSKSSTREQELKAQLMQQAQTIQALETQLGDVTGEIADATMPLSIEIEKLQSELKLNELQFQKREKQLNDQLLEMNFKLKQSIEREKSTQDYQMDFKTAIKQLENQVEQLESGNRELSLQVQNLKEEKAAGDKKFHMLEAQVHDQKNELSKSSFIIEKLENDLKAQTTLYETEKKKCVHLMEQLRQYQQHEQSASFANESGNTSPNQSTLLRTNRSPTMSEASYLEEVFESNHMNNNSSHLQQNHNHPGALTPKSSSIFDSMPIYNQASASSPYLETLYVQLRHRENELIQLQTDSMKNEKIRKTLNDEIAKLTVENQQLDSKLEQLTDVQSKLQEVEKNYNAVLQLYGEKVEEVEELRMDLADVKEMFKTQIEQLVKK